MNSCFNNFSTFSGCSWKLVVFLRGVGDSNECNTNVTICQVNGCLGTKRLIILFYFCFQSLHWHFDFGNCKYWWGLLVGVTKKGHGKWLKRIEEAHSILWENQTNKTNVINLKFKGN